LLAGYLLTLFGCPTKETEPDAPLTNEYVITGEVHLFNACNTDGVTTQEVKVEISLIGEGTSKSKSQTITLKPSSDVPPINVGSYEIVIDWDETQDPPTKWGALTVKTVSGSDPCTFTYDCIDTGQTCIAPPDSPAETEVTGTDTIREDYYINCFCAD